MKHNGARIGYAVVFAVTLMAGLAVPAHAWDQPCSLASVAGKWKSGRTS
jgi:hypothetical protein